MPTSNVFVKPRLIDDKPALVRDPNGGKPLAENGEWKPKSQFWIRRIAQGDVIDETAAQHERQKAAREQQQPDDARPAAIPANRQLAAPSSSPAEDNTDKAVAKSK